MIHISHLTPKALSILEQVYTNTIQSQLDKFAWADRLLDDNGHKKYGIFFGPGSQLVIKADVSTTIRIVIIGVNVFDGGPQSLKDPALDAKVISVLERCSKALRTSILEGTRDLYEVSSTKRKKTVSNWEQSEEVMAIPPEESIMLSYSYTSTITVKDIITGDIVEITGTNEADELMHFRARNKLWIMRQYDQEIEDVNMGGKV